MENTLIDQQLETSVVTTLDDELVLTILNSFETGQFSGSAGMLRRLRETHDAWRELTDKEAQRELTSIIQAMSNPYLGEERMLEKNPHTTAGTALYQLTPRGYEVRRKLRAKYGRT